MKSDNLNHEEKVVGAGRRGTTGRRRTGCAGTCGDPAPGPISVIVSPAAWDEAGQLRSAKPPGAGRRRSHLLAVDIAGSDMGRWLVSLADSPAVINCIGVCRRSGTA